MLADGVVLPPKLYHVVYRADLETRQSVRDNGLVSGRSRHEWHPQWAPRPGHVYLATSKKLARVRQWGKKDYPVDVFSVDTTYLARQHVNPDEDWFIPSDYTTDFGTTDVEGNVFAKHPLEVFKLPPPPNPWVWEWATYMKASVPSFGEWADLVGLSTPEQTRFSLSKGTVAYRGEVPPVALQLVHSTLEDAQLTPAIPSKLSTEQE